MPYGHAISEAIPDVGEHPNPCTLLTGVSLWTFCAAEYAKHVAWLVRQMEDAGMVAEAEVLLQQLYAAVQAVKVRSGLLLCLWHCRSAVREIWKNFAGVCAAQAS